ncbi:hypothetical protein KM043_008832 [Ampulex compressa]|nr:hypothetical protein KM043_008832 [Ampulex compressa]
MVTRKLIAETKGQPEHPFPEATKDCPVRTVGFYLYFEKVAVPFEQAWPALRAALFPLCGNFAGVAINHTERKAGGTPDASLDKSPPPSLRIVTIRLDLLERFDAHSLNPGFDREHGPARDSELRRCVRWR